MVELFYENQILQYKGDFYTIVSLEIIDDNLVHVHIMNQIYNSIIALVANDTTINDVIQTSAQMIYDTLSSNG